MLLDHQHGPPCHLVEVNVALVSESLLIFNAQPGKIISLVPGINLGIAIDVQPAVPIKITLQARR